MIIEENTDREYIMKKDYSKLTLNQKLLRQSINLEKEVCEIECIGLVKVENILDIMRRIITISYMMGKEENQKKNTG